MYTYDPGRPRTGPLAAPCCPQTYSCSNASGSCRCCAKGRCALCWTLLSLLLAFIAFILFAASTADGTVWGLAQRSAYVPASSSPYQVFSEAVRVLPGAATGSLCANTTATPGSALQCSDCAPAAGATWQCQGGGELFSSLPALDGASKSILSSIAGAAMAAAVLSALHLLLLCVLAALMGDASRTALPPSGLRLPSPACPALWERRAWANALLALSCLTAILAMGLGLGAMASWGGAWLDPTLDALKRQCTGWGRNSEGAKPPAGFRGVWCYADNGPGALLCLFGFICQLLALLPSLAIGAGCGVGWLFCATTSSASAVRAEVAEGPVGMHMGLGGGGGGGMPVRMPGGPMSIMPGGGAMAMPGDGVQVGSGAVEQQQQQQQLLQQMQQVQAQQQQLLQRYLQAQQHPLFPQPTLASAPQAALPQVAVWVPPPGLAGPATQDRGGDPWLGAGAAPGKDDSAAARPPTSTAPGGSA